MLELNIADVAAELLRDLSGQEAECRGAQKGIRKLIHELQRRSAELESSQSLGEEKAKEGSSSAAS